MKIAKCMSIVVAALLVVAFCAAATPKIDTGQSAVGAWFPIPCGTHCSHNFDTYCDEGPEGHGYNCTHATPLDGCLGWLHCRRGELEDVPSDRIWQLQ